MDWLSTYYFAIPPLTILIIHFLSYHPVTARKEICAICVLCESYSTIPHEGKINVGVSKFRSQALGEDGAMVNPAMSRP